MPGRVQPVEGRVESSPDRKRSRHAEPIVPAECLYYLISRATLVATSVLKHELADCGAIQVRPSYLGVLMTLWSTDGLGVVELGRRAGLEPSTMTGLLDRMQRDGLLLRVADPKDRRALQISLTEDGKRLQRPVLTAVSEALARATEGFSEEELSTTKDVLRRFLVNMQEERRECHGKKNRRV
ncbi:MAG: MarR family winged helix-turn-helix transcriptional regulator [Candidatus Binatia bacterium]